jgi:outer membrane protein OmpA-like peptidoglycan-associated protein
LLNNLARAINNDKLKSYSFLVEGHTDAIGNSDYNYHLSSQRALTVEKYLSTLGVSKSRLKAIGKGSSDLLVPAKPDAPENRRVKIIVNTYTS